jgi:hypothetical protein
MSQHSTASASGPGPNGRKYEDSSVSVHQLFWFAVGVVGLVLLGVLVSTVTFNFFANEKMTPMGPNASPFEDVRQLPGDVRLQTNAPNDLKGYRQAQEDKLAGYGWVDQPAGVVHIPITRAMDMMLQKGYPLRGSAPASETAPKNVNKAATPKAATGGKHP